MDERMSVVGSKPSARWFGRQADGMGRTRYVALLAVGVLAIAVWTGALVAWGYGGGLMTVLTSLVGLLWIMPLAVLRLRHLGRSAWGAGWLFLPLFGDLFLIVWAVMGLEKRKALAWGFVGAVLYFAVFGGAVVAGEELWWASVRPDLGVAGVGMRRVVAAAIAGVAVGWCQCGQCERSDCWNPVGACVRLRAPRVAAGDRPGEYDAERGCRRLLLATRGWGEMGLVARPRGVVRGRGRRWIGA